MRPLIVAPIVLFILIVVFGAIHSYLYNKGSERLYVSKYLFKTYDRFRNSFEDVISTQLSSTFGGIAKISGTMAKWNETPFEVLPEKEPSKRIIDTLDGYVILNGSNMKAIIRFINITNESTEITDDLIRTRMAWLARLPNHHYWEFGYEWKGYSGGWGFSSMIYLPMRPAKAFVILEDWSDDITELLPGNSTEQVNVTKTEWPNYEFIAELLTNLSKETATKVGKITNETNENANGTGFKLFGILTWNGSITSTSFNQSNTSCSCMYGCWKKEEGGSDNETNETIRVCRFRAWCTTNVSFLVHAEAIIQLIDPGDMDMWEEHQFYWRNTSCLDLVPYLIYTPANKTYIIFPVLINYLNGVSGNTTTIVEFSENETIDKEKICNHTKELASSIMKQKVEEYITTLNETYWVDPNEPLLLFNKTLFFSPIPVGNETEEGNFTCPCKPKPP